MSEEALADSWDAEMAYKRVMSYINATQAKENPTGCMVLTTQYGARTGLCDSGTMPVDLFEQALEQLEKHEGVVVGSQYLSYPPNLKCLNRAREYVVSQDEVDKQFIASSNRVQKQGVFDS